MKLSIPCKVCDRGSLDSKRIYRMNGPAVVIGYILLIPSILGILFSAAFFVGVAIQSLPDARQRAASEVKAYLNSHKVPAGQINEFLECPLAIPRDAPYGSRRYAIFERAQNTLYLANAKTANIASMTFAKDQVAEQMREAFIPEREITKVLKDPTFSPDDPVDGLSESQLGTLQIAQTTLRKTAWWSYRKGNEADFALGSFIDEGVAIVMGISAFVGGLLGWLLVMKKRVLQCNSCNAVVEAG
jgi:hypothetical protein